MILKLITNNWSLITGHTLTNFALGGNRRAARSALVTDNWSLSPVPCPLITVYSLANFALLQTSSLMETTKTGVCALRLTARSANDGNRRAARSALVTDNCPPLCNAKNLILICTPSINQAKIQSNFLQPPSVSEE